MKPKKPRITSVHEAMRIAKAIDNETNRRGYIVIGGATIRNRKVEPYPPEDTIVEKPSPSPRLLTLKQAAAYLGLTTWAMRERIWAGHIPVVRFPRGRKQYIDIRDLEKFIEKNKTTWR